LPLPTTVSAPKEIRIPPHDAFVFAVDAPAGTVVARAVYYNNPIASPKVEYATWHWSEHWLAPSVRQSLDAPSDR